MFRFFLNFIGFLLSFVFTEKIMHEVWHLRNVIYSSIVRCHFKSIGKINEAQHDFFKHRQLIEYNFNLYT